MRPLLMPLTLLSLLLCVASAFAWVRSFEPRTSTVMLTAGQWHVGNWRGQVWLLRHRPNPEPSFVRTTVYLGLTGRPVAVVKALVFDQTAPWDEKHDMPSVLLSRPYVLLNFRDGIGR